MESNSRKSSSLQPELVSRSVQGRGKIARSRGGGQRRSGEKTGSVPGRSPYGSLQRTGAQKRTQPEKLMDVSCLPAAEDRCCGLSKPELWTLIRGSSRRMRSYDCARGDLADRVFPGFNRSGRDLLTQCNHIRRLVLHQSTQNSGLDAQVVAFAGSGQDAPRPDLDARHGF